MDTQQGGVETFINISTDKAARPTSVLGATKRLGEMIVSRHAGAGMRVASVRFGNVLGSRGSFLHSLAFQVRHGLPVTVTHPDVTRFFMTIPEAASLVLEASGLAASGEIYVLDMGEPVRIMDLVDRYARAVGEGSVKVTLTGLRPGEKLHEELFDETENRMTTSHWRIWCVNAEHLGLGDDLKRVLGLADLDLATPIETVRKELFSLLPGAGPVVIDVGSAEDLVAS